MKRKHPFVKNHIYHIYNRGVEKRDIFLDDNDRWRFLQGLYLFNDQRKTGNLLWELEKTRGKVNFRVLREHRKILDSEGTPLVRIIADCLMPNHFHLLLEELTPGGITKFMHKLGTGYGGYFNQKYKRVGGLFQGRFKSILVDNDLYLQYLLVYINVLNPAQLIEPNLKEEGIKDMELVMQFAENYPWSTHQEYLGKRNSHFIDKGIFTNLLPSPKSYKALVRNVLEEKKYHLISHIILE